jgi:hypothetical protein
MHNIGLKFLAIGALFFAADRLWWEMSPRPPFGPIVVAATADPERADVEIDEEILFREALAHQLDRDRAVQVRLARLGSFLGLGTDGDIDRTERDARALGLHRTDPIIRRHLIEMMRIAASQLRSADYPSEATLIDYYRTHSDRFIVPAHIRFTHVYLSAERHGTELENDAAAVLGSLRREQTPPEAAASLGDPFVRGSVVTLTPQQVDDTFGPGFAAALANLPERTWAGPVQSTFGEHLVWISARTAGEPAPYASVRSRILHEVLHERREQRLRDNLRDLRARYDVRVEPAAAAS